MSIPFCPALILSLAVWLTDSAPTAGMGDITPQADVMVLAEDGEPRAVIVIPDTPHRTEEYAASELQKYLERVSGARLEIIRESEQEIDGEPEPDRARVLVGSVRAAARLSAMLRQRDADAFLVRVEPKHEGHAAAGKPGTWHDLFLLGATPRATLWAVYDFLEREVGCRWLGPGELWEELPRRKTIALSPGARLEEPSMKYRLNGVLGRGLVDGPDFREDLTDYALKRRANVAKRMNIPLPWAPERARRQLPLPIDVRAWYDEHGGPAILRAASRDRSEWFAMAGEEGVRSRPQAQWQMCFSNPEVRDLLADRLSRLLRERPELEFVEVGCLDGLSANYCRCEGCAELDIYGDVETSRRGEFTHRWLALVNAVAADLAESDPDRKLLAAAYGSYQAPPDPAVIVPADNVMISYYTWSGCRIHGYEHGLEDPEVPEDQAERHATHREWIDTWLNLTPAGVFMVEYLGRGSMDGITGTNPRRYIQDLAYLYRKGFVGYMPYDYPSTWGFRTLNQYAAARARWDATLEPDEVLRDFCDHAFRAASADMQRFVQVIQDAMAAAACGNSYAVTWIQPETLVAAREHLEAAQAAARGDAVVERRLQTFAMHFRYAELAGTAYRKRLQATSRRDPELLRAAIHLGRQAADFRREMTQRYPRSEYPELQFGTSPSIGRQVIDGGSWHILLQRLERETARDNPPDRTAGEEP